MSVCVYVHYQVLNAAQYCCGQQACEEGHEVEAGQDPDQSVQSQDVPAVPHTNKLIVVVQVASTAEQDSNCLL